jgi:signal transduction histidine kinase
MRSSTEGASTTVGRVRSASMRRSLALLIAAVVIPAVVAFSLLIYSLYRHERAARERQLFANATVMMTAVDADLGRGWALLEAMAKSDALAARDWTRFEAEAKRLSPPGMYFLLVGADGRMIVNTRATPGEALPTTPSATFAARWRALQLHERDVSNVFVGRVAPRPTVALDMLVRQGGRPAYALSLLMDPSVQQQLLASQGLPNDWVAGLLDGQGVQIARIPPLPAYVGKPGTPDMVARVKRREQGVVSSTSVIGQKMVVAFARSKRSGWTGVVAAPKAEFDGGARSSLILALTLAAAVLLAGVLLSAGLSRRLVRAMRALTAQAAAVGEGLPAPAAATGVLEADQVSEALARAAAERAAREAELASLNAGLEGRVAEATERLVQAQKMEALGQLTGGFAHDFNNLLAAILGNLYLLGRTELSGRQQRLVTNAESAGERGAKLTGQLLTFSRRQRLVPESLDLNAEVERVVDLLPSTLGEGVRLSLQLADPPVTALADRTQLELAILNLALNARDAMPTGGLLTLTVGALEVAAGDRDPAPAPGRYAMVAVSDTGEGMARAVRERAFEPFFTTKGPGRGSGLGLPQVLGMARQLDGGVMIESAPGAGTTIQLLLPLSEARLVRRPPLASVQPTSALGLKVLVVDDDASVRAATVDMLAALGCEVIEAPGGDGALSRLDDDLDLVLADYAMPGLTGADLAVRIAALRPTLPVLIITGYADPGRLPGAWSGPLLTKPFDLETLAIAVRAATATAAETAAE